MARYLVPFNPCVLVGLLILAILYALFIVDIRTSKILHGNSASATENSSYTTQLSDCDNTSKRTGKLTLARNDQSKRNEAFPIHGNGLENNETKFHPHSSGQANIRSSSQNISQACQLRAAFLNVTDDSPVFIVGASHSGTTLMAAMLDSHPRFCCGPESYLLKLPEFRASGTVLPKFMEWEFFTKFDPEKAERARRTAKGISELARTVFPLFCAGRNKSKARWAEKTPVHSAYMSKLRSAFPDSKVIVLLRDGLDVIASLNRRNGMKRASFNVDRWISLNRALLPYLEAPWMFRVWYEDLVNNPALTLSMVSSFLGEGEASDQYLSYLKSEAVATHRAGSQRQYSLRKTKEVYRPVHNSSIGQGKSIGTGQRDYFLKQGGAVLMQKLGYWDSQGREIPRPLCRPVHERMLKASLWNGRQNGVTPVLSIHSMTKEQLSLFHFVKSQSISVNGASALEMPVWASKAGSEYVLYFAAHRAKRILMATSSTPLGPWQIANEPALDIADAAGCTDHIASPDVHVLEDAFVMYFHSVSKVGQVSFVAHSRDGRKFTASCYPSTGIAPFYLRVFNFGDQTFGLAKKGNEGGLLVRRASDAMFTIGPMVLPRMRHASVVVRGSKIAVFYSRIGDDPERILISCLNPGLDWQSWFLENERTVLLPEVEMEGSTLDSIPSRSGSETNVRQLRDPYALLTRAGKLYLFFSFAGEEGIKVTELNSQLLEHCDGG